MKDFNDKLNSLPRERRERIERKAAARVKEISDECIPCCDYCKHYTDNGDGPVKRNGFAGIGQCSVLKKEVGAHSHCDDFVCSICH